MKRFLCIVLGSLSALALTQVDPNRTVVVVNGEEIKGGEYYHRMEYLTGVGKQAGNAFAEFPPGFLTIEQLITERLVFQLAKEKGVLPSDAEVQAEIQNVAADNPNMIQEWLASGRTRPELDYEYRYQLAQFKIVTAGVNITDQQVEKFYRDNPSMFTIPKKVKLRVIVVSSDSEKNAVDGDLRTGKKFEDVAKARSLDITKQVGGDFGTVPYMEISPDARKAIDNRKADGTTDWVPSGANSIKFLVLDVIPESKQPLDAKLKRQTRRQMMLDAGHIKNDIQKDMNAMRLKSKVDIKQKEFAEAYSKFIQTFVKGG